MSTLPTCVIDNGTGWTKIGFAGNDNPSFMFPSTIAVDGKADLNNATKATDDLDFYIGFEAENAPKSYVKSAPLKHGQIENWTLMEMFWEQTIFKYLRCEPEDHYFLLTEPPMNPPENREYLAEIYFETFNAPGIYIAVQAVLAIVASWSAKSKKEDKQKKKRELTACVIDSGDGVTHVIPVFEGCVIGSSIKSIPLAGKNITSFIQEMMLERGEKIPPTERTEIAKICKESYSYVSKDITKEFGIFDSDLKSHVKVHTAKDPISKKDYKIEVGYEQFLAPELFFNPEIFDSSIVTPLPDMVDDVIQSCPIDTRRELYGNIVLSGGSTMFKGFDKRLQRDVRRFTDFRASESERLTGRAPTKIDVNVISYPYQRYAVWYGGSVLGELPCFVENCHTRKQYEEIGPAIARYNAVFNM